MDTCHVDEATLTRPPAAYELHDAAEADNPEWLASLLDRDEDAAYDPNQDAPIMDINERDPSGCTPLHVAVLFKAAAAMQLLLARGAKSNLKCNGSPLLHVIVAMAGIPDNAAFVTRALELALGVPALDALATDDVGRSVLHIAAAVDAPTAAAAVLAGKAEQFAAVGQEKGAPPPAPTIATSPLVAADKLGRTPLHTAAAHKAADFLSWVVEAAGSSPVTGLLAHALAVKDGAGDTPLHVAARAGWTEGYEALLAAASSAGVAVDTLKNAAGATPAEVALPPLPADAPPTLILSHDACAHHHTCLPPTRQNAGLVPPENIVRLETLLYGVHGTLRAKEFSAAARGAARPPVEYVYDAPPAEVADVLRVHEYPYVRRLLNAVGATLDMPTPRPSGWVSERAGGAAGAAATSDAPAAAASSNGGIAGAPAGYPRPDPPSDFILHLDGDTAVSRGTWDASLRAAGAVCTAIDAVLSGRNKNAFCPVRPPGHHAGPRGIVTCGRDKDGSHGFCMLNNVAIGAAYARATYGRPRGGYAAKLGGDSASSSSSSPVVRRVVIFDFDAHHGNGTDAILRQLYPLETVETVQLPFARGAFSTVHYRPWLDTEDGQDVLFVSTHGYGKRNPTDTSSGPEVGPFFYPGSGASSGWEASLLGKLGSTRGAAEAAAAVLAALGGADGSSGRGPVPTPPAVPEPRVVTEDWEPSALSLEPAPIPEPLLEKSVSEPFIINVGMPYGAGPKVWRRALTLEVLPRIAAFKPDLILISAGFDGHHKDAINCGYLGLREEDYEWVTNQLVKIANTSCDGRVVSVLEGGYRVQGRIVSAFGRSVAAHVRALAHPTTAKWDTLKEVQTLAAELAAEAAAEAEKEAAKARAAAEGAAWAAGGSSRLASPKGKGAASALAALVTTSGGSSGTPGAAVGSVGTPASTPAAATTEGSASSGADPSAASASSEGSSRRPKRARSGGPVDYAALDAQLRAEEEARKAKKPRLEGGVEGSSSSGTGAAVEAILPSVEAASPAAPTA